jgi:hypothetical protein
MTFSFYSNGIQFNGGGVTPPPGEYVTPDGVQTLTNKTIDADKNTLKNIGLDELEDGLVLQEVGNVDTASADKLVSQMAVAKAVDTFIFDQAVPSDTWVISHDLNKYPSVTVTDSAGTQFMAQVEYNSRNQLTVYLNGATTGKAYLN